MTAGVNCAASCPCTCGELFQGALDGRPCLVSCPVTIYSTARISADRAAASLPQKARRALERLSITPQPAVSIQRQLPEGRGYGTSTADIGSVLFAVSRWAGRSLDALQISRLAVAVEPTDSSLLPGLALFDHLRGEFHEELGSPPPVTLVIIDPGGMVDSEAFNRQDWSAELKKNALHYRQAFDLLRQGIARQSISEIGEAATMSAAAHQRILYSPWLEPVLALSRQVGAAGICRAHSGTILGMLFPASDFDEGSILPYIQKHLPREVQFRQTALTGGGPLEDLPNPFAD
jgi:L-threonine kinase